MSPLIAFRLINSAPKLGAENYERLVIGGLKGSSMVRERVAVRVVIMISECAVAMALVISIGRLNTEQSAQHWLSVGSDFSMLPRLSTVWQGMAVDVFWSLCCDISGLPPVLSIEQVL